MTKEESVLEKLVSLCKRRGFIYQGSEIYGGLAGTWDYGPHGTTLKNNIKQLWWQMFVTERADMFGVDAAILMNPQVWEASGHVAGFADPLIEDAKTKERFRLDHILEDNGIDPTGMSLKEMSAAIEEKGITSPKGNPLGAPQSFNMMFQTAIGASEDSASISYLRPETAAGMFVNYKNVVDSFHPSMPFGLAQIGKAFRNEIAPRDFVFRTREFEQMEIEWFCHEREWETHFEAWRAAMHTWIEAIGLSREKVHELEVGDEDRAHYSKRTIDFEYDYPFGRKELYGLAYRTDHDLRAHQEASGAKLEYFDQDSGEKYLPHVVEPSFGLDRTVLALLSDAYDEEVVDGGETRVVMRFARAVAPVEVAVLPLMRKPELTEKAHAVYQLLVGTYRTHYDETGSIGKRYRRQDEIGTPLCVTIDFDTLEDDAVTVRNRDTMTQERIAITELATYLATD